jgi:hypothetical protein
VALVRYTGTGINELFSDPVQVRCGRVDTARVPVTKFRDFSSQTLHNHGVNDADNRRELKFNSTHSGLHSRRVTAVPLTTTNSLNSTACMHATQSTVCSLLLSQQRLYLLPVHLLDVF